MLEEWPIWRLVVCKGATLVDMETVLTLDDVMRLNAVYDVQDAISEALTT